MDGCGGPAGHGFRKGQQVSVDPGTGLADAVSRFGPSLAEDATRCRAVLADLGVDSRATAALVAAVESGAAAQVAHPRPGEASAAHLDRLARTIQERMATDPAMARWAVATWSHVLTAGSSAPPLADGPVPTSPRAAPTVTTPGPNAQPDPAGWQSPAGPAGSPPAAGRPWQPAPSTPPQTPPVNPWVANQPPVAGPTVSPPPGGPPPATGPWPQPPSPQGGAGAQAGGASTAVEPWASGGGYGGGGQVVGAASGGFGPQPAPPRKRRTLLWVSLAAVLAVLVAAGVVVAITVSGGDKGCSASTPCLIAAKGATVAGRPITKNTPLETGTEVSAAGDPVRITEKGADIYLDNGTRVTTESATSFRLSSGRAWVTAPSQGSSPTIQLDIPRANGASNVSIHGAVLVDTTFPTAHVFVRSGQASLRPGGQVSAGQRSDIGADGTATNAAPFAPDAIPADTWADGLPNTFDPLVGRDPTSATVAGNWHWDRTVTDTTGHDWHVGDLTHRQLDLASTCQTGACTLTASYLDATAPVTYDGATYQTTLKIPATCDNVATPNPSTVSVSFKPSTATSGTRPRATALTGTWKQHFDAAATCKASDTSWSATAAAGNVDPKAFPTSDEETALPFTDMPWKQCQRGQGPSGATAAVSCTGTGEIASVTAFTFPDQPTLLASYNARVAASGQTSGAGFNKTTGAGEGPFTQGTGRILEFVNTNGRAELVEELDREHVEADFVGTTADVNQLDKAWLALPGR